MNYSLGSGCFPSWKVGQIPSLSTVKKSMFLRILKKNAGEVSQIFSIVMSADIDLFLSLLFL